MTFAQRQLAGKLRTYRKRAGRTQEDAAAALGCEVTKIWRLEQARSLARVGDVRELAIVYGLGNAETDDLLALARGAKERGWIDRYVDTIPSPLSMLATLESAAEVILHYSVELVPGLIQTPEYARHLIGMATDMDAETRRSRVSFRMARREQVLNGKPPPRLNFVIHEAALRTQVGDSSIMVRQLDYLRELQARPEIDVRVWTFQAGLHRWMSGRFSVMQFGRPDTPDIVFTENQVEGRYIETPASVAKFVDLFGEIHRQATPIEEYEQ